MVNVQIINDVHLSDHAPIKCQDTYTDDLFELLYETVSLATEYKAVTVFAGDVFHLKQPSRNSHSLVQRAIDLIKSYPHQVYIVPGNHDLLHDRLESIPSQPIGTLLKSGATLLKGWENSGLPIYGVPWLQRFTDANVLNALAEYRNQKDSFRHSLIVTHAPLYPPGQELPYENYPSLKWAEAAGGKDSSVAYGHVHDFHGVWQSGGVQFCNNGSLSRGALTESQMQRAIMTTMWSSINGGFTAIKLNAKPSEEVFKMSEVSQERKTKVILDDFLKSVQDTPIELTSLEAVMDQIKTMKLDSMLETTIRELLEEATENDQ